MGAGLEQAERGGVGPRSKAEPDQTAALTSSADAFSLLRRAPALVLLAIAIADAMRSADTDLWGHIFFGRLILGQHQLWFHAPYSYACPPGPRNWPNLEWLGSVVLAIVYDTAGVIGLKLGKFVCVAWLIVFVAAGEAESGASLGVQAVVLLLTAMALLPQMQFRPVLGTYVLFAALVAMLARESYGRRAPLWLTVPMLALWVNLHGGFFVGLAALGLYALVRGAQDMFAGKGIAQGVRLAALTSAAALATLLNPYGLHDWLTVASYLHNAFTLHYISEFRPLLAVIADRYRHGAPLFPFVCALTIMAGLFVTFALAPRADDLALFAVAALMTASALYAARNTALAVIAAAVPLCRHTALLAERRGAHVGGPMPRARPYPRLQVALAAAAALFALRTGLLSRRLPAIEDKPAGAVAFMHEHGLHGNLLCEFGWADYLLWHDAARSRIFIESLFEAYYPHALQRDYAEFYYARPGAARVLDAYANDFVLMPAGSPAAGLTAAQKGWRLIYRDPVAALFARAKSPAARLAGIPAINETRPPSVFP